MYSRTLVFRRRRWWTSNSPRELKTKMWTARCSQRRVHLGPGAWPVAIFRVDDIKNFFRHDFAQ
ncbi:MAG: hypothetical protein U0872_01800 [Planctomycetaceae bacterium]